MVNSVVKGDLRAFEVALSGIVSRSSWISPDHPGFLYIIPYELKVHDKKESTMYHRVPGSSGQKTNFGRFGEHPSHAI